MVSPTSLNLPLPDDSWKKRTNKITLIVCNKPIRREDATSDIVGETHRLY